MMLYMTIAGSYLGFYNEIGGPVVRAGWKGWRPVYSYSGSREKYSMVKHTRATRELPCWKFGKDKFTLREIGTGHLSNVSADFIGVAKSVGPNEFVV